MAFHLPGFLVDFLDLAQGAVVVVNHRLNVSYWNCCYYLMNSSSLKKAKIA